MRRAVRLLPVVAEARPWLAGLGVVSLALLLRWPALAPVPLSLLALVAFFFRDPERRVQAPPGAILSPADGRVVEVDEVDDVCFLHQPARRVSIFLSLLDVHVNRSPVGGRVVLLKHQRGRFRPAFTSRASAENERNCIGIQCDGIQSDQGKVLVVQVAGILARRIECWVSEGELVEPGQRIGLIRFGSRAEIILPRGVAEVLVQPGARVRAGETTIARWL